MHVVERPQVGQLQQQFGEARRLHVPLMVVADERAQRSDQVLLQRLHRRHILDTGPI